jgi:hypothetical protein
LNKLSEVLVQHRTSTDEILDGFALVWQGELGKAGSASKQNRFSARGY